MLFQCEAGTSMDKNIWSWRSRDGQSMRDSREWQLELNLFFLVLLYLCVKYIVKSHSKSLSQCVAGGGQSWGQCPYTVFNLIPLATTYTNCNDDLEHLKANTSVCEIDLNELYIKPEPLRLPKAHQWISIIELHLHVFRAYQWFFCYI